MNRKISHFHANFTTLSQSITQLTHSINTNRKTPQTETTQPLPSDDVPFLWNPTFEQNRTTKREKIQKVWWTVQYESIEFKGIMRTINYPQKKGKKKPGSRREPRNGFGFCSARIGVNDNGTFTWKMYEYSAMCWREKGMMGR